MRLFQLGDRKRHHPGRPGTKTLPGRRVGAAGLGRGRTLLLRHSTCAPHAATHLEESEGTHGPNVRRERLMFSSRQWKLGTARNRRKVVRKRSSACWDTSLDRCNCGQRRDSSLLAVDVEQRGKRQDKPDDLKLSERFPENEHAEASK